MPLTISAPASVSVYVLADDGKLYRDPLVCGDGWQLLFPSGDAPTLMLADTVVNSRTSPGRCASAFMSGILHSSGFRVMDAVRVIKSPQPHWRFRVHLDHPPPARLFPAQGESQPRGRSYIYSFGRRWG